MEFSSFFYQIFVCHVSSKESIILISFHNKIWRYDAVTTALWQNEIIVIVCSIFLKCLGVVPCEWGILSTTPIDEFKKKHEKQKLLVSCLPIAGAEQHYHISPKNDLSQKSLFDLLNHLWYKPKTIRLFFPWTLWVRWRKGLTIDEMTLWNVSCFLSKNCLLGSIEPVEPFIFEHSIDFNVVLSQLFVYLKRPSHCFNFDGQ